MSAFFALSILFARIELKLIFESARDFESQFSISRHNCTARSLSSAGFEPGVLKNM